MKIKWNTYTLAALSCALFSAYALTAVEDNESYRAAGARQPTMHERMQSKEDRALYSRIYPDAFTAEEELACFEEAQRMSREELEGIAVGSVGVGDDAVCAKNLANTSHYGAYHAARHITPFGDTIVLENGSRWAVRGSDQPQVLGWYTNERLVITPNHDWFSSYDYRITNLVRNQTIRVNIVAVPAYNSPYTHWIAAIDYLHKKICLEDGSVWSVSNWDGSELKRMEVDDTVIIGTNDSWFKSTLPNVLINTETMEYVKVKCDSY